MKRIYQNMVKGCLMGAAMIVVATSCTDDHFDIQPGTTSSANTLWQNIEATPELDSLAMILKRAKVMKSELDQGEKQTFAQLLNQPQELTIWAPKNGTYNAKQYLDKLDEADALRETDLSQAMKLDYEVSNQFVRNHIARFNHEAIVERQQVRLMNSKLCFYDASQKVFNGVSVDASFGDINSSNGMMHVLDGQSPFAYNIYDYITTKADLFSQIYAEISAEDQIIFSPEASTEGTMNDDGYMEYVDSVFIRNNTLLSSTGALISNEDSLYIAIIPSDDAWDEGMDIVKKLFHYADKYNYEWSSTANGGSGGFLKDDLAFNTDSLMELNAKSAIVESMFISPSYFKNVDKTDSAALINYVLTADSLECTNGVVIYNKAGAGNMNPIFAGIQPIKASNGYIFPLQSYTVDPAYSFMEELDLKAYRSWNVASVNGARTGFEGTMMTLTSATRDEEIAGDVEDGNYALFQSNGQTMTIKFRLDGVYSGHYKVSVEMLPNKISKQYAQVEFAPAEGKVSDPRFNAQILDDQDGKVTEIQRNVHVNQDGVEIITLWDDVEFTTSYAGLPSGYTTFPILQLEMTRTQQNLGKCDALSISRIIVEPVRE